MDERRRYPRLTRPLDGTWQGQSGASPCRIADISWGGCFIQTLSAPSIDDRAVVSIPVRGTPIEIEGVVVYIEKAMGFSVKFGKLTADQIDALTDLLGEPPESVF